MSEPSVWDEVDDFIEKWQEEFNLSFGLEYSSTVDWNADFTPRRNHPHAREYPLWRGTAVNREDAIRNAIKKADEEIGKYFVERAKRGTSPEYGSISPIMPRGAMIR